MTLTDFESCELLLVPHQPSVMKRTQEGDSVGSVVTSRQIVFQKTVPSTLEVIFQFISFNPARACRLICDPFSQVHISRFEFSGHDK